MQYRELGDTGEKVSVLGFGMMRLPFNGDKVDQDKTDEMVEYAYENGVNYFDTAENYLNHSSENVLGIAVKNFRKDIKIASKVGIWHVKNESIDDVERLLDSQLKRLQTDYIDFYMIHALTDARWKTFKKIGIIDFFEKKKAEGIIKYYGFSYHGTPFFYKKIIDEYDWEFSQIQFNYVDQMIQAGEEGLVYADKNGLGTIIMEPLKGGQLVNNLPPAMNDVLKDANPERSLPSWALNYLWNRRDVDLVLSGMSELNQVKENVSLADESAPDRFTDTELKALSEAREIYESLIKIKCTSCRYCLPCPAEISIPRVFEAYNLIYTAGEKQAVDYFNWATKWAKECKDCGQCEANCPQGIDIRARVNEIFSYFAELN